MLALQDHLVTSGDLGAAALIVIGVVVVIVALAMLLNFLTDQIR